MATLNTQVTSEDHFQGAENGAATLVEYGDYECSHCGQAYGIVKRVQKHFGKGLRFVFRNFPLSQMHPHAESAAETAEFAGAHGKFWEMHDGLFENQQHLGGPLYSKLAQDLSLSPAGLQQALSEGMYKDRVRADFSSGVRSGVNGTPTFFINGKRHDGPFDYESLVQAIEEAIGGQKNAISA
ncbi:MAG TPA: thioredoxin domain-containing protein [Terriglobales bacterium]|jgi:protein-disulfide isomerase|nr:thioredoxin domain-containing protein [Terriglobales bacterium]